MKRSLSLVLASVLALASSACDDPALIGPEGVDLVTFSTGYEIDPDLGYAPVPFAIENNGETDVWVKACDGDPALEFTGIPTTGPAIEGSGACTAEQDMTPVKLEAGEALTGEIGLTHLARYQLRVRFYASATGAGEDIARAAEITIY